MQPPPPSSYAQNSTMTWSIYLALEAANTILKEIISQLKHPIVFLYGTGRRIPAARYPILKGVNGYSSPFHPS